MTTTRTPPVFLAATPVPGTPTAAEALAAFTEHTDPAGAVGFAYTPTSAPWFTHTPTGWHTHTGEPVAHTTFELRAFTPTAELRWWRDPDADTGTAVVLTDTPTPPAAGSPPVVRLGHAERSLLLWGSVTTCTGGWANLADPRIGDILWIPLPHAGVGAAVRLQLVEYTSTDAHGNVAVTEQRFTGLHTTPPPATTAADSGEPA